MRAKVSGKFFGGLYIGALVALASIFVLQTVPMRRPAAPTEPANSANMQLAFSNGKDVSVYLQRTGLATTAKPALENTLRFEGFHVERTPSKYSAIDNKWVVGHIVNQGSTPVRVRLTTRFQNSCNREVATGYFHREQIGPWENALLECPLEGDAASAQIFVYDNAPGPLVTQGIPSHILTILLLSLVGFALHLGLASWLRPNGWEDRLWSHSLK